MSEKLEIPTSETPSESERNREGISKREHLKIKYTKEFLLSFAELEVCCKLPNDFDCLILQCEQLKIKYTKEFLLSFAELEVCCKLPRDFDCLILRCKQPKIKYTKEFLLSFAELEVCCKLPRDFDCLILRCEQPKIKYTKEFLLSFAELEVCCKLPIDFDCLILRCEKPKIKYTKEFLLSFTELEVCCKLPRDFDCLILHELDVAADGKTENKKISGSSSLYSLSASLELPGEKLEVRTSESPLDSGRKREDISKCEKPKIKYTKEFLLSFTGLEFCCKLPRDFDLLILHELEVAVDDKTENKNISGNSSLYSLSASTRSVLGLPGENWRSHTSMLGKENQSQLNFNSERSGGVHQFSPGVTGYRATLFGSKSQRSNLSQLRKGENPYRPPHYRKEASISRKETDPPANNVCLHESSLLGQYTISPNKHYETNSISVAGSNENKACVAQKGEVKGSDAGGITQNVTSREFNNHNSRTTPIDPSSSSLQMNSGGLTIVTKKMLQAVDAISEFQMSSSGKFCTPKMEAGKSDAFNSMTGNNKFEYGSPFPEEVGFSNIILGKCEASWTNKEGSGLMAVANKVQSEMIEDDEIKFDDVWAEILEKLQLEQQSEVLTPTSGIGDLPGSEVDICLLDDDSLKFSSSDICDDEDSSEAEITLPDEDNLITLDDLIYPHSSMPAHKLRSNMAVNIKNLEALNLTELERYTKLSSKGLVAHGKLHYQQSHSETSSAVFNTKCLPLYSCNGQEKFLMTPNITPWIPTQNWYTCSPSLHQPSREATLTSPKPNDLLVQYSLSQQPKIGWQQQNLMTDATCSRLIKQVTKPDLNTVRFLPWDFRPPIPRSFGISNAVARNPSGIGSFGGQMVSGRLNNEARLCYSSQSSGLQPGLGTSRDR